MIKYYKQYIIKNLKNELIKEKEQKIINETALLKNFWTWSEKHELKSYVKSNKRKITMIKNIINEIEITIHIPHTSHPQ